MSALFKGVRKVFKKVFKAVKKLLPVILAVGALVFTGGAALGLTGTWASMAGSVSSALGASGAVGSALTGAITQAGTGALIGGTISKAGGGSFSQGAKAGAITGAVTGGISGAYGHLKSTAATKPPGQTPGIGDEVQAAGVQESGATTFPMGDAAPGAPIQTPPKTGGLFNQGGFLGKDGWVQNNQDLVGKVVGGIGAGMIASGEADAEKDLLRERQRIVSENYAGSDPGQSYRSAAGGNGLAPKDRFSASYYGSFEYRYNPDTARIERVPVGG